MELTKVHEIYLLELKNTIFVVDGAHIQQAFNVSGYPSDFVSNLSSILSMKPHALAYYIQNARNKVVSILALLELEFDKSFGFEYQRNLFCFCYHQNLLMKFISYSTNHPPRKKKKLVSRYLKDV